MKKIIILVLTFLLTACSTVSRTPLTAVNDLDIVKDKLYEIDNLFHVESDLINIFHVDDQCAYINIWNVDENKYEFYKYSDEKELELIHTYEYEYNPRTDKTNSNTSCVIYNDQLIFTDRDEDNECTKIFKVKNGKQEKIYEVNALIYEIELRNNCLFFGESKTVEIKEDVISTDVTYRFLNLDTYKEESSIQLYNEFNYLNGKITENSSSYYTFESDDGHVFEENNYLYFHDYLENKDIQLFKLDKELNKNNYYVGNDQCIVTFYDDAIHFIVKEENKYQDYYIEKDSINYEFDYFHGGYINEQYYFNVSNSKNQFIMFDYINKEFSVYKNENWHKEGYLHIIDGQVYCIDKKEDKIVIEKCTFTKV